MNKILIHYFSGTGNTNRAVRIIENELTQQGFEVVSINIEKPPADKQIKHYDFHLIAFPVYALSVPSIMQRYIRHLPKVNDCQAGVLAVFGNIDTKGKLFSTGYSGQALSQAKRMLVRRGFDVNLTEDVGYPHNITMILNTPKNNEIELICKNADEKVKEFSIRIGRQRPQIRRRDILNLWWCWFFGMSYNLIGRIALGKMYVADEKCNQCGKCVRDCPRSTIRLIANSRPRWGFRCEGCQRCINICPQKAIQTSIMRVIIFVGLAFIPYPFLLRGFVLGRLFVFPSGGLGILFDIVLWLILYVLSVFLADKLLFLMELIPGIRRLFQINFTYRYRRYIAPNKNKDIK